MSAPKYQGLDWRVDVVAATNNQAGGGRGAVPTTLLKLRVQETPAHTGVMPAVAETTLALQRPALNTLFKELCRIRDELSETTGVGQ